MRLTGTLIDWKDDRGFGFIEPEVGSGRVFCHISAFEVRVRRPMAGDRVTYVVTKDGSGRINAKAVRPLGLEGAKYQSNIGTTSRKRSAHSTANGKEVSKATIAFAAMSIAAFFCGIVFLLVSGRIHFLVLIGYCALSIATLLAYAFDKSAAMNKRWRIQEQTLLVMGLLGGWPGGWLSQVLFRHKSRKLSFLLPFWFFALLNVCALIAYAFPEIIRWAAA
jgi:uncharacterized membrane protein YsdA (DUF1294 family)/cold shock CspA family protein